MIRLSYKSRIKTTISIISVILICHVGHITGQQTVTLEEAIRTALKNNPTLLAERHRLSSAQALENTAWEIPPTNVRLDAGQFNSIFFDTRLGVSQSFSLPMVYRRKKRVLQSESAGAMETVRLSEAELRRDMTLAFSTFHYCTEKEKMLMEFDSIYTQYEVIAASRVQRGEADAIEKALSSRQKSNLKLQLQTVINEKSSILLYINHLLFSENQYTPATSPWPASEIEISGDTSAWRQHPLIQLAQTRIDAADANLAYKKSLGLPSFTLGYNNLSIRGTGADNINYNASYRFNYLEAGLQIPLFRKSLQADVRAASHQILAARADKNQADAALIQEIQREMQRYNYLAAVIDEFKSNTLPQTTIIEKTAAAQLRGGSIDYLDYVLLVNQLLQSKEQYIELKRQWYESRIQLQYLTHKNTPSITK